MIYQFYTWKSDGTKAVEREYRSKIKLKILILRWWTLLVAKLFYTNMSFFTGKISK